MGAARVLHGTADSKASTPPSLPNKPRPDSRPESSNSEEKTENSPTEVNKDETTSTTISPTAATGKSTATELENITPQPSSKPSLSPLTDEQIKAFADQLNTHVVDLEEFRTIASKKLREAMARKGTSDEELSQFFGTPSLNKRSRMDWQSNPQITNSVW